ncbi:MAG: glycosyltransferase [Chloroflexi bacterium]|nr:glycosyltransferase [Chloroflexota bacterium]
MCNEVMALTECLEPIRCSVGVTAHNEEANIGQLLEAMCNQRLYEVGITEIIVVASGCTDRTEEIVREMMAQDPRVKLIVQPRREGKTSAINLFLKEAQEEICVLESGDTCPREDSVENLVRMFRDPSVGMTGAQKVPVNAQEHIVGYLSHLRLRMEHQLCMEIPRLGEMIAFRKVFDQIPTDVAMDEAFVEALVIQRGLQVRYAPDAVVYNMGPETVSDFIRQRRRNYAGHLYLKAKYNYKVSSLDSARVARIALEEVWGAVRLVYTLAVLAAIEAFSRVLGAYDFYIKRERHVVWDMAWTTKKVDLHGSPTAAAKPEGEAEPTASGKVQH